MKYLFLTLFLVANSASAQMCYERWEDHFPSRHWLKPRMMVGVGEVQKAYEIMRRKPHCTEVNFVEDREAEWKAERLCHVADFRNSRYGHLCR